MKLASRASRWSTRECARKKGSRAMRNPPNRAVRKPTSRRASAQQPTTARAVTRVRGTLAATNRGASRRRATASRGSRTGSWRSQVHSLDEGTPNKSRCTPMPKAPSQVVTTPGWPVRRVAAQSPDSNAWLKCTVRWTHINSSQVIKFPRLNRRGSQATMKSPATIPSPRLDSSQAFH